MSRKVVWFTRRIGLGLIMAALFAMLTIWQSSSSHAQETQDSQLLQQGNQLYVAQCSLCHGGEGLGNGSVGDSDYGPPLINVGAASVDFMLSSGRMPPEDARAPLERRPSQFSETERQALIDYVTQLEVPSSLSTEELREREIPLEPGADIPTVGDLDTADLSNGRALFTTNCAACHGPTAAGIAVGQRDVSSNLAGVPPQQVATAIRSGPGVMPVFNDDILDQEGLTDVVAWVDALPERAAPGGLAIGRGGPVSEGMVAWVVGMGLLGLAVYLLGERVGSTAAGNPEDSHDASDDDAGAQA